MRITRGRVSSVDVDGYGAVQVDAVISTVSGMLTVGSLLDPEHVPEAMRRKARSVPLSHKALSIQLGLSNTLQASSHPQPAQRDSSLRPAPLVPAPTTREFPLFPPVVQAYWAGPRLSIHFIVTGMAVIAPGSRRPRWLPWI